MNLRAISKADLLLQLKSLATVVAPRGPNRTTPQTESWITKNIIPTLAKAGLFSYPLDLKRKDKPDLVIQMPTGDIGIEITEAVPQIYAHADAIRNQHYPNAFIDRSIFTWGTQFTPQQIHDHLKQSPQILSNDSPGWTGDTVETELARAIEAAFEKKLTKLNGPTFRLFPQNWLAIYASVPGPLPNHRKIAKLVSFSNSKNYRHAFDRIFVLCGKKVIASKGDTFDILQRVTP